MPHPHLNTTAASERSLHDQHMLHSDFSQAPFTIAWEVTRACAFACVHCRADAQHQADPRQLTHEESLRLIERMKDFGSPILVFTGGDPLMRRDLFDLIAYATQLGLRCSLTPTATALATTQRLEKAKEAGIRRIALSLDAASPAVHDDFRQVPGSWARTLQILKNAHEVGLSAQVNTTVSTYNVDTLAEMVPFIQEVGAVQWSLFFLVPTGRAQLGRMVSPETHERIFNWLYDLSTTAPFDIKVTAAPMYRRVAIQRRRAELGGGDVTFQGAGFQYADGLDRPTRGVNDGNGFLFISHVGDIQPSGFLPLSAGNVREADVVDVYRHAPLFTALRDAERIHGKCGVCEFRSVCGGQRGRAYGITGDYLASDPACAYAPAGSAPASQAV